MDPWKDPPGWRAEVKWGIATLLAASLILIALPMVPAMRLACLLSDVDGRRC